MQGTRVNPLRRQVQRCARHTVVGLMLALLVPIVLAQVQVLVVTEAYGPAAAIIEARGLRKSPMEDANIGRVPSDFKPDLPDFAAMSQLERDAWSLNAYRTMGSPWEYASVPDPRCVVTGDGSTFAWVGVPRDDPWLGRSTHTGRAVWWFGEPETMSVMSRTDSIHWLTQQNLVNPFNVPTQIDINDVPIWSVFSQMPTAELNWKVAVEQSFGWPCKSSYSVLWLQSTGGKGKHGGYTAMPEFGQTDDLPTHALLISKKKPDGSRESTRHIPLGIIPMGLLINTLVYACITLSVATLLGLARRRMRIIRGRCPICRYQLGDAITIGCPECGWRRD